MAAVLNRLIAKREKSAGGKKAADERKRKGDSFTQNLQEAKKLSSGVIVNNGIHSLNDKQFLEAYNQRRTDVIEKSKKTTTKKRTTKNKKLEGVNNCERSMETTRLTFLINLTWRSAGYISNKKNNLLRTQVCQRA